MSKKRDVLVFVISTGDGWNKMSVDLYSTSYGSTPFRVVVKARRGLTFASDIAVDDLSFSPGCNFLREYTK